MNKELIKFIIKAKKSTYASVASDSKKILRYGSKEFIFTRNGFSYRDRYFGSDSFAGQEVVFSNNQAIWAMNYHGYILDETTNKQEVYAFLKQALLKVSEQNPYRGPVEFKKDDYKYSSISAGNINSFNGKEIIYYKDKKIYKLYFHGGLIR